jgi:hypothetical protein
MNNNTAATISYDSSGNLRWSNTYPLSWGYSIVVDREYNTFITGVVEDSMIRGNDYLTIKYSSNGTLQWVRKYNYDTTSQGWGSNTSNSVVIDLSNNIYVTGTYNHNYIHYYDDGISTVKYNTRGDSIWVRKYPNAGTYSATIDSFSNIYIASGYPDSNGSRGYFTIKYDSSGQLGWSMFYSTHCYAQFNYNYAVMTDILGNVYVTGSSAAPDCSDRWDMTTIKYSQPLYGIKKISNEIPKQFKLYQNYPNPFNPGTKIKYQIPKTGYISLVIYDILGRKIETLIDQKLNPGTYEIEWNASKFSSGVYFYQLVADENIIDTKKLVVLK